MTKSDLKTGMKIEIKCGERYLVLRDVDADGVNYDLVFAREGGYILENAFNEDLSSAPKVSSDFDIVAVYPIVSEEGIIHFDTLLNLDVRYTKPIWENVEELTLEELYKELGRRVRIVERKVNHD